MLLGKNRRPAGVFCGCSGSFHLWIASARIFALLALLRLGTAFRLRLGTPSVESLFDSISWLSLCYNFNFFVSFF
jgi:hypothetical protein